MEQQRDTYDILQLFFTVIVATFPGVILLATLLVMHFIIKKGLFKILGNNVKRKGLIFNSFALLLVLIAIFTCIDRVFWATINTAIPLLIVSLSFNRNAQKLDSTKIVTRLIYILIVLTVFLAIISYLFKF